MGMPPGNEAATLPSSGALHSDQSTDPRADYTLPLTLNVPGCLLGMVFAAVFSLQLVVPGDYFLPQGW